MTPEQFKAAQSRLGMTNQQLADALDVSLSTIVKWRAGAHTIPKVVDLALKWLQVDTVR